MGEHARASTLPGPGTRMSASKRLPSTLTDSTANLAGRGPTTRSQSRVTLSRASRLTESRAAAHRRPADRTKRRMAGLPALPLRRIARPGPRGPGRRSTRGGRPATSRVNTPTRSYTTSDDLTYPAAVSTEEASLTLR
jgi:hypothetical protein